MRTQFLIVFAALAISFAGPAAAEEKQCKLYPKAGLLANSYDLVGAEACKSACQETDGCHGWSYTPHNFNPKTAPGQCRLMAEIGEEVEDQRDFCGQV